MNKFTIHILDSTDLNDFRQLLRVFDIVFEYGHYQHPDENHLTKVLNNELFKAIVAKRDGKVIAGLTAHILHQYHTVYPNLYIQDLAVLNEFQRQGIGISLMEFTVAYASQQGYQQVYVQAEKIDDYAVDFYRKTNPTGELDAVHFYYNLPNWNEAFD